jgi:hypothetical protein
LRRYAGWLFGLAAAANFGVGGAFALAPGTFARLLALDPIIGTNAVIAALAGVLIVMFGYGYLRIALDPARFRPLIHIGAIGKLAAVATVLAGALMVPHVWRLAALVSGDVVFAGLFFDYLRRTSSSGD